MMLVEVAVWQVVRCFQYAAALHRQWNNVIKLCHPNPERFLRYQWNKVVGFYLLSGKGFGSADRNRMAELQSVNWTTTYMTMFRKIQKTHKHLIF